VNKRPARASIGPEVTMRALLCVAALTIAAPAFADNFAVQTLVSQARLDNESAEKVQSIVEKFRPKIDSIRHEDRELLRSIRVQLASTRNDKAVAQLSDQLIKNRGKLRSLRADRLSSIKKALPPTVFARLLLAMPKIDRALYKHSIEMQRGSDS
jgi:hypothetical protein